MPVLASVGRTARRPPTRESAPGHRPDHRQRSPSSSPSCCRPGAPACRARSAAIRRSTAAVAASSDASGSSRSCCSSCSSLFSLAVLRLRRPSPDGRSTAAPHRGDRSARSLMTRTDSIVVGALVVLLALIAGLVGVPALTATTATPSPTGPTYASARGLPRGHRRASRLGQPADRADPGRPRPRRAHLQRPRPQRPGGTIVPDLAARWTVDATGKTWTFHLRDGRALARRRAGHRRRRRASRSRRLQDPAYMGPAPTSWSEVDGRRPVAARRSRFTLTTPLGGFLQAATQPIAPAHLLGDVPVDLLPDHPFGRQPVGSGPFAAGHARRRARRARPGRGRPARRPRRPPTRRPSRPTRCTTARPTRPPGAPDAVPRRDRPAASSTTGRPLAAAYRAGDLDAASGLPPATAADLAADARQPAPALPGRDADRGPAQPARRRTPSSATRRCARRCSRRSTATALVESVFAGAAVAAPDPVPPSSPLFDAGGRPGRRRSSRAGEEGAQGRRLDAEGRRLAPARREGAARASRSLSPDEASNPVAFAAAAGRGHGLDGARARRRPTWRCPPGEFVTDRLAERRRSRPPSPTSTIGLDPDLYPLLALEPDADRRLERHRRPGSDARQAARRGPDARHEAARKAAYSALQKALATGRYLLPLAFPDEVVVVRDTVHGPAPRQVADPSDRFWDVLTWRLADGR